MFNGIGTYTHTANRTNQININLAPVKKQGQIINDYIIFSKLAENDQNAEKGQKSKKRKRRMSLKCRMILGSHFHASIALLIYQMAKFRLCQFFAHDQKEPYTRKTFFALP